VDSILFIQNYDPAVKFRIKLFSQKLFLMVYLIKSVY